MLQKTVFISYAQEDGAIAKELYNDLREAGVNLWLEQENIKPRKDWQTDINKVTGESAFFLALISSKSMDKKGHTQEELNKALEVLEGKKAGDIFVIPVRVDDCQIDSRLQRYHMVDLYPSYTDGLKKLLNVLKPDLPRPETKWARM